MQPSLRFRARRRHNCCRSSDSETQDLQPLFGPPEHPEDDNKVMALFFSKQGRHVVCGGTTSKITARYLGKEIVAAPDYSDPSIPPTASIEGVDLVTEGVITIARVLDYAKIILKTIPYLKNGENKRTERAK